MTDNDIIKALECCVKDDEGKNGFCNENCPLFGEGYICADFLRSKTLDLINRKDAEIEKLNVELVGMRGACESYKIHYDIAQTEIERLNIRNKALTDITKNYDWKFAKIKSEAIKEFAEELSLDIQRHLMPNVGDDGTVTVENAERYFLKRIKEMTEVKNNE